MRLKTCSYPLDIVSIRAPSGVDGPIEVHYVGEELDPATGEYPLHTAEFYGFVAASMLQEWNERSAERASGQGEEDKSPWVLVLDEARIRDLLPEVELDFNLTSSWSTDTYPLGSLKFKATPENLEVVRLALEDLRDGLETVAYKENRL